MLNVRQVAFKGIYALGGVSLMKSGGKYVVRGKTEPAPHFHPHRRY